MTDERRSSSGAVVEPAEAPAVTPLAAQRAQVQQLEALCAEYQA
jgi:hypothetical protein